MPSGTAQRLLLRLLALAAMLGFAALGTWQLGRAQWKENLLRTYAAALRDAPSDLSDAMRSESWPRRATGKGRYDAQATVLLDNQVRDGQVGAMVLTLFRPDAGGALLVNRGFVPRSPSRELPPLTPPPEGAVGVQGLLTAPPAPGLKLGNARYQRGAAAPELAWLDLAQLQQDFGVTLYRGVLLLDPAAAGGFVRQWQALPNTLPPERHRGYAVQWFGLALAVLVVTVILEIRRR